MENLNAETIKTALKCCDGTLAGCKECPNYNNRYRCNIEADALALITSQEQRIGELTDNSHATHTEFERKCASLNDDNERLRDILLQFTDIVHKWGNKYGYDTSEISLVSITYEANKIKSQIEADTVRKMQEALEQRIHSKLSYHGWYLKETVIPETTKELLNDAGE